ncbi:MAG: hypothetical protein K0A95_10045 [Chromatiales bacterium]|nr:hypothetical protein [Gammaproteobacteria bacterium]MBW6477400.1 hypothetical protein [Chromatiales bacterium]
MINTNPSTQQSSLAPLYPQTQQELRTPVQNEAASANPVEPSMETSNEQPQARSEDGQQSSQRLIDTYA